jgi:hypothetical protein
LARINSIRPHIIYVVKIRDPHAPEVDAWLGQLEPAERLTAVIAISFAFVHLREDPAWRLRIEAGIRETLPTAAGYQEIIERAETLGQQLREDRGTKALGA